MIFKKALRTKTPRYQIGKKVGMNAFIVDSHDDDIAIVCLNLDEHRLSHISMMMANMNHDFAVYNDMLFEYVTGKKNREGLGHMYE